jgi:hypothetical protein
MLTKQGVHPRGLGVPVHVPKHTEVQRRLELTKAVLTGTESDVWVLRLGSSNTGDPGFGSRFYGDGGLLEKFLDAGENSAVEGVVVTKEDVAAGE